MIEVVQVLDERQYQQVLAIRRQVFVEEQGVPAELEIDAHESEATFFLALRDGEPLGTGRFRVKGPVLKFERIATLHVARGLGVGSALMRRMEDDGARMHPRHLQYMHAQASAVPFYLKTGWEKVGAPFYEAGIEHFVMIKPPTSRDDLARLLYQDAADGNEAVRARLAALLRQV